MHADDGPSITKELYTAVRTKPKIYVLYRTELTEFSLKFGSSSIILVIANVDLRIREGTEVKRGRVACTGNATATTHVGIQQNLKDTFQQTKKGQPATIERRMDITTNELYPIH